MLDVGVLVVVRVCVVVCVVVAGRGISEGSARSTGPGGSPKAARVAGPTIPSETR